MKENKVFVYCLVDPILIKIRYIGITKSSLERRLYGHISESNLNSSNSTYKNNWIQNLKKRNCKPIIKLLKVCSSREEASKLESQLILKYINSHKLTNCIPDEGKFQSTGYKSAKEVLGKMLYIYDYNGNYLDQVKTIQDAADKYKLIKNGVKKCLSKENRHHHNYQFSRIKLDKMIDLDKVSHKNEVRVYIRDEISGDILEFKNIRICVESLSLSRRVTNLHDLPGILNKKYGKKYSVLIGEKYVLSTYYNTNVTIVTKNQTYFFNTKKECGMYMGYKTASFTKEMIIKYANKYFNNIIEIIV